MNTAKNPAAGAFANKIPPAWVAELESGERVSGKPSWLSQGLFGRLPIDAGEGVNNPSTDWRRLMARCSEQQIKLASFSLWVCGRMYTAPRGRAAYGYFEVHEGTVRASLRGHERNVKMDGVKALCMCWPERDERGWFVKVVKVWASGVYEEYREPRWKPCMIGECPVPELRG